MLPGTAPACLTRKAISKNVDTLCRSKSLTFQRYWLRTAAVKGGMPTTAAKKECDRALRRHRPYTGDLDTAWRSASEEHRRTANAAIRPAIRQFHTTVRDLAQQTMPTTAAVAQSYCQSAHKSALAVFDARANGLPAAIKQGLATELSNTFTRKSWSPLTNTSVSGNNSGPRAHEHPRRGAANTS